MPDNTIVFENSNLASDENVTRYSSTQAPSTNNETVSFHSDIKNAINTTADSVGDNMQRESTNLEANVKLNTIDEKQFEDIVTFDTTTDETFERTTYIANVFLSENIVLSETSYLPSTINLHEFEKTIQLLRHTIRNCILVIISM